VLVYAIAVGLFLGAACLLVLFLHRALVAEDARYCARAEQPAPSPPAPATERKLDRAA
jgi:hypothetical protein